MQAVPHNRDTIVRLYQEAAPRESRKIRGRFVSATTDSITLRLKDGQTSTVQKTTVRKVLTYRPFVKRWQGMVCSGGYIFVTRSNRGLRQEGALSGHPSNLSWVFLRLLAGHDL